MRMNFAHFSQYVFVENLNSSSQNCITTKYAETKLIQNVSWFKVHLNIQ